MHPPTESPAAQVADRLTAPQAATYLGVAVATLARHRSEGRGPRYLRLGNRIFYRRRDLDAYLEACVRETHDSRNAA